MKVAVSPELAKHFPTLPSVVENSSSTFDLTIALITEQNGKWLRYHWRQFRPYFVKEPEDAKLVLDSLGVQYE